MTPDAPRLLIACRIFEREIRAVLDDAPVDVEWLAQGLHNEGPGSMRRAIQAAVDGAAAGRYAAILLGYGFCGRGLEGVHAGPVPVIMPRAHDCLALLLGDCAAYERRVREHPGTYWRSSGWIEQVPLAADGMPPDQLAFGASEASPYTWTQLVAKFGEEEAREIRDAMTSHLKTYDRIAFIETGAEPDGSLAARAMQEAAARRWSFENVRGDLGWLRRLVHGPRDDREFLVVPPWHRIAAASAGGVVIATDA